MGYFLYNLFLTVSFALAIPFAPFVLLLGARCREGWRQRLGQYPRSLPRGGARPVWIHAASVGEVRSVEPLVRELKARFPERPVLLSTFTATGHRIARGIAGVDAAIFLPFDLLWIVRRGLARLRPAVLLIVETELWPNLLREAHRRGVPTLLLSGRLSAKAARRYALWRSLFRAALNYFTALGMQSEADAARIRQLGAEPGKIAITGSLKYALPRVSAAAGRAPAKSPGKPVWVAGSSHRGEEKILLEAFGLARSRFPELSLVLAPRHPERFDEVEKLLRQSPFDFQRKSRAREQDLFGKDILLLDTLGELREFFAAGDVAFVGGSLVDRGGHNIAEPARFHKPILFGPNMGNFELLAERMKDQGAAIEVCGAEDLARALVGLLEDSEKRRQMGAAAFQIVGDHGLTLQRNFSLVERFL